jgi:hypothetical protein
VTPESTSGTTYHQEDNAHCEFYNNETTSGSGLPIPETNRLTEYTVPQPPRCNKKRLCCLRIATDPQLNTAGPTLPSVHLSLQITTDTKLVRDAVE